MTAAYHAVLAAIMAVDVVGYSRVTSGDGGGGLACNFLPESKIDVIPIPSAGLNALAGRAVRSSGRENAVVTETV
jgi:hypothetical protein